MREVLAVILGGGRGTRLYPLTKYRSKPAVPLAGKYRLIDIPISNCLNSGISRIFVLTQYNSASLNRHINLTYHFDHFRLEGFVDIIAAEQTEQSADWFQGTADAVRKTLIHYSPYRFDYYLILSGDHIYSMDYREMIGKHIEERAEVSVATIPVSREKAPGLGILVTDGDSFIRHFVEKPKDPAIIGSLVIGDEYWRQRNLPIRKNLFLANMGIYIFNRKVLEQILNDGNEVDFGAEIFPRSIRESRKVRAHLFEGYWEDIGTIRSFYEANLGFLDHVPKFSFYNEYSPIYTHSRFLPPSKINRAFTEEAILSEGCIVENATIHRSLVGVRSIVGNGATLVSTILMGADYHETPEQKECNRTQGIPDIGIGEGSYLEGALIDKNARIGENVKIVSGKAPDTSGEGWVLKDGIIVIEKNAVIPDGTQLIFR